MKWLWSSRTAYAEAMIAAHITSLTEQVEYLKTQIASERERADREQARANRAEDALLAVRGFPTVTPPREGMPDIPDSLEEDPEAVSQVEKRMAQGDASVFTERF